MQKRIQPFVCLLSVFANGDGTSTFDLGKSTHTTTNSGSLLDDYCSRCHMPSNYVDQIPLENVIIDPVSGQEHASAKSDFDPTSDNGTGEAFATVEGKFRNTQIGKLGDSASG